MANKTPVWYDGGFGVYTGDDTIHHNYTEATGNVLTLQKGGVGNEVLQVLNKGEVAVKSITGATSPALDVNGLTGQDFLTITDHETSDHVLTVRRLTSGSGWITDLKVRDSGAPSNDDVALRITHDVQSNTPPLGADLFSAGYTDALEAYQELFAMKQSGDLYLQGSSGADLLWGTDSGGNVGGSAGNRPDNVYAASTVNANGSVLQTLAVQLGPAGATDKTITALQSATSPYIKYVNGSTKWQFSNDGTTPLDFGTSNVASWNDLYDLDADGLDVDTAAKPFTITQTATTGTALYVTRNLTAVSTNDALVEIYNQHNGDDQPCLTVNSTVGASNTVNAIAVGPQATAAKTSGIATGVRVGITPNAGDTSGGTYYGFSAAGSATGSANKYGYYADGVWDLGLYSLSPTRVEYALTASPGGSVIGSRNTVSSSANLVSGDKLYAVAGKATGNGVGDAADALMVAFSALGDNATSGLSYGFHADNKCGYGLYSESLIKESITDVTASAKLLEIVGTSGGLADTGKKVSLIDLKWTEHASAEVADIYGVNIALTPDATADNTKYAVHVDSDWDYGLYSQSPVYVTGTWTGSDIIATLNDFRVTSGGVTSTSNELTGVNVAITDHASDTDVSYTGLSVSLTSNATANAGANYGVYVGSSDEWTYGIRNLAKYYGEQFYAAGATSYIEDVNYMEVRSGGLTAVSNELQVLHINVQDHADDADTGYTGLYLTHENNATANAGSQKGIYADASWDYGLYSLTKSYIKDTLSGTESITVVDTTAVATAARTAGDAIAYKAQITPHASDTSGADYYGFSAAGSATGSAVKYAYYADGNWDYGLYSQSTTKVDFTGSPTSDSYITESAFTASSQLGAGRDIYLHAATITPHASDPASAGYYGYGAFGSTTGDAGKIAFTTDANWDYSFYGAAKGLFTDTLSDTGTLLSTTLISGGLDIGEIATTVRANITGNAGDHANSALYGFYAEGSATGSAIKVGLHIDANWSAGVISYAKNYFQSDPANGGGTLEEWVVESKVNTDGAGLASNDEVAAYKVTLEDDADDGGAFYYGINFTTTDVGPAAKWGIYFDGNWPVDHYALRINSGLNYFANNFGTTTTSSTTNHFDIHTNATLGAAAVGTAVDINVTPGDDGDASSWNGVLANLLNTDGKTTYAFKSTAHWDYALYSDNGTIAVDADLDDVTAPTTRGTIDIDLNSTTGIAVASYYGGTRVYYTRNASDAAGNIFAHYVNSNGVSGDAIYYGLYADVSVDYGVASLAETSVFSRGASAWVGSTSPVLQANNGNASNIQAGLRVVSANTGDTGKCLEIGHSYDGSDAEDTRRAIVFTSAQTNVRAIPLAMWQSNATSTTTVDWEYKSYSVGATRYQRYMCTSTIERYVTMPLLIPHDCTITEVEVRIFHTNVSTTAANFKLIQHSRGSGTATERGTVTASTSAGAQTLTISGLSQLVSNKYNEYYLMYKSGAHSSSSVDYVYSAAVTYEITDFAAGCGW